MWDEFGAALQFPWDFAETWVALEDCLRDLSWLPADAYILAVFDSERRFSATKNLRSSQPSCDVSTAPEGPGARQMYPMRRSTAVPSHFIPFSIVLRMSSII